MAKGVNEVDSWAVASYVDCRSPTLKSENAACPNISFRTRRKRVCAVAGRSADERSDAPAWWWSTALAAVNETATMPVEWCATLGIADEFTFAKGAEVFMNALDGQIYLPWSENFPRKFRAIDAVTGSVPFCRLPTYISRSSYHATCSAIAAQCGSNFFGKPLVIKRPGCACT